MDALEAKDATDAAATSAESAMLSQRASVLRATLMAHYTAHAPTEVHKVETLVARVVGGPRSEVGGLVLGGVLWTEAELYAIVERKYGAAVVEVAAAEAAPAQPTQAPKF